MAHQVADLVDQFVRLDAFLMDFIFEAAMKLASLTGLEWTMFLYGLFVCEKILFPPSLILE